MFNIFFHDGLINGHEVCILIFLRKDMFNFPCLRKKCFLSLVSDKLKNHSNQISAWLRYGLFDPLKINSFEIKFRDC